MTLTDRKILFTGATGQAFRPAAEALARDNEVWCAARFTDPVVRRDLESVGIKTIPWVMGAGNVVGLPSDFTHVVHAAPYRGQPDSDTAAQANAVAAGMLMHHCRAADAFVFVSAFAVYKQPPSPDHRIAESDPLGGHAPYAPTYPIGKLAAEAAVRAFAGVLGLRTTIARLNVCYGPTGWGGVPVEFFGRILAGEPVWLPEDGSDIWSSPISTDDVTMFLPRLWDVASMAPTIVNLAGDDALSLRGYCTLLARQAGLEVDFVPSAESRQSYASDNTRRRSLIGDCRVGWAEGMRRAIEAHFPNAFTGTPTSIAGKAAVNIWDQR
ncbi:NAD-dependent epimerase/dehydratase family protein [Streptomyces sp. bgisy027]|uniref:NAD-dependent epimerase/dehydratase family protein n=1 Tax=Streptomyces sp. bgisy027 TaxID=3413770 RepID=UPI003D757A5F